jgi:hypothetical protein
MMGAIIGDMSESEKDQKPLLSAEEVDQILNGIDLTEEMQQDDAKFLLLHLKFIIEKAIENKEKNNDILVYLKVAIDSFFTNKNRFNH